MNRIAPCLECRAPEDACDDKRGGRCAYNNLFGYEFKPPLPVVQHTVGKQETHPRYELAALDRAATRVLRSITKGWSRERCDAVLGE